MFEDDLRAALRPIDPPAGFEHRVLARLDEGSSRHTRHTPSRFAAWAAAAGLAFASFAGVAMYRQRQEEQRGVAARDQLLLALRITGTKLDAVRNRINYNEAQVH